MSEVQIKCRYRRSPRSIDPQFDACVECIVSFGNDSSNNGDSSSGPTIQITTVVTRQRSFHHPPIPCRRRDRSRSTSITRTREFSVVESLGLGGERDEAAESGGGGERSPARSSTGNDDGKVGYGSTAGLEMDESDEGEWVGSSGEKKEVSPPGNCVGGMQKESDGLPPTKPKGDAAPLVREHSNVSLTPSKTPSQRSDSLHSSSCSRSLSRSRSRSRARGTTMMRKRSIGAHAAFNAFSDAEIDNSRSGTPLRSRGYSVEEEQQPAPLSVPLGDVLSVDQEIPSRRRHSSASSDFFSSVASDTGSAQPLSPPKPSDSYHGKSAYRVFLHTSSNGYIEFSIDNPNSHDILMAFLSAHLKPDQLPRKTPNDQSLPPITGAMQTMVLTPSTMEKIPSNLRQPLQLTRSTSTDSACTLDKLQKKIIQQRIQSETTPLERIKENVASWMSSIVDCACCQDTSVAPDPDDKNATKRGIVAGGDMSPASKFLKRKGIGGLSFEESSARMSPRLSFEKSVATENSGRR